jgi:hypothetical protein
VRFITSIQFNLFAYFLLLSYPLYRLNCHHSHPACLPFSTGRTLSSYPYSTDILSSPFSKFFRLEGMNKLSLIFYWVLLCLTLRNLIDIFLRSLSLFPSYKTLQPGTPCILLHEVPQVTTQRNGRKRPIGMRTHIFQIPSQILLSSFTSE